MLRISVEAQDNSSIFIKEEKSSDHLVFFSPTEGVVTDVYDLENLKSYLAKEIYPKCEVLGVDVRTSYNQPSSS